MGLRSNSSTSIVGANAAGRPAAPASGTRPSHSSILDNAHGRMPLSSSRPGAAAGAVPPVAVTSSSCLSPKPNQATASHYYSRPATPGAPAAGGARASATASASPLLRRSSSTGRVRPSAVVTAAAAGAAAGGGAAASPFTTSSTTARAGAGGHFLTDSYTLTRSPRTNQQPTENEPVRSGDQLSLAASGSARRPPGRSSSSLALVPAASSGNAHPATPQSFHAAHCDSFSGSQAVVPAAPAGAPAPAPARSHSMQPMPMQWDGPSPPLLSMSHMMSMPFDDLWSHAQSHAAAFFPWAHAHGGQARLPAAGGGNGSSR